MLRWLQNEKVRFWLRIACTIWEYYAHTIGVLFLSFLLALLLVTSYDNRGPVFETDPTIPTRLLTPVVPKGGSINYVVHSRQNQPCPGSIVTTFTLASLSSDQPPAIITARRPITRQDIGMFRDVPISIDLPDSIWPGKWRVTVSADSQCPLRQMLSRITEFDIEVVP
jgi:hypothetical protein